MAKEFKENDIKSGTIKAERIYDSEIVAAKNVQEADEEQSFGTEEASVTFPNGKKSRKTKLSEKAQNVGQVDSEYTKVGKITKKEPQ
jgi:hypothetical protein